MLFIHEKQSYKMFSPYFFDIFLHYCFLSHVRKIRLYLTSHNIILNKSLNDKYTNKDFQEKNYTYK